LESSLPTAVRAAAKAAAATAAGATGATSSSGGGSIASGNAKAPVVRSVWRASFKGKDQQQNKLTTKAQSAQQQQHEREQEQQREQDRTICTLHWVKSLPAWFTPFHFYLRAY
jgi:hypothetical protein